MSKQRTEGWGSTINIPGPAHYFRARRALCGRVLIFGQPMWEDYQDDGPEPKPRSQSTCLQCKSRAPAPERSEATQGPDGVRP